MKRGRVSKRTRKIIIPLLAFIVFIFYNTHTSLMDIYTVNYFCDVSIITKYNTTIAKFLEV